MLYDGTALLKGIVADTSHNAGSLKYDNKQLIIQ